jgi:hypothetical protein
MTRYYKSVRDPHPARAFHVVARAYSYSVYQPSSSTIRGFILLQYVRLRQTRAHHSLAAHNDLITWRIGQLPCPNA